MEENFVQKEKVVWYAKIGNFLQEIVLTVCYIFSYAFIGIKACTFDLFVFLYNAISWRLDKAYKATKGAVGPRDFEEGKKKKKKEKKYNYSAKTLAKLEQEYQELVKDLETSGATRSKEVNVYYFKVRDNQGKIITGTMSGLSKLDINSFLINEGYTVYSIKTSPMINFLFKESKVMNSKMTTKELIFFLTQLSTYVKSGITLTDSVKILSKQMSKKKNRARAFQSICYELTLGSAFSSALEKQGSLFPPLLINMLKAAEASGTLVATLDDMVNYYTEIDETHKQMVSAMTYPAIITVFAVGVIIFILTYIIPQFVEIYEANDISISGITLIVVNIGTFLSSNLLTLLLFLFVGLICFIVAYKQLKAFRRSVQSLLMHIPVIKDIIIYNQLTILTKTFASLLRNNVFITDSIDILSKIVSNEIYKAILFRTINNIIKGEKISEAFKDHWAVPDVAYYMIVTGESTGELDNMMQKVSEYYQGMHKSIINNLKAFIEPVLIAVLALVVGVVIISVVMPMFEMYGAVV